MSTSQVSSTGGGINNQMILQTAKVGFRPGKERSPLVSSQGPSSPTAHIFDKRVATGRFNMRETVHHNKLTQHLLLEDSRVSLSAFGSQADPIS